MKKNLLFVAMSLMVFASCSQDIVFNEDPVKPNEADEIKSNFESVFGFAFNANQDWSMINSGELTIKANSSVKKVQILVDVNVVPEGSESWVTPNELRVVNEKDLNGETSFKMTYDAPKSNRGMYVAFTTDNGLVMRKVEGNSVSIEESSANSRLNRSEVTYPYPTREFAIDSIYPSYANSRTFIDTLGVEKPYLELEENVKELLYDLDYNDYDELRMTTGIPDYSDEFKDLLRTYVFQNFPNGKGYDNLPKVKASGVYNASAYPVTTGNRPVVVTPIYKCDNPEKYGAEVWNSDLYYYYYKDGEQYVAPEDTVKFLQSLPKFKAIPFNKSYALKEDNIIMKKGSFVLLYFGDADKLKNLKSGDLGKTQFPAGYKIGFMIRAKTNFKEQGAARKQGEVYGDGRLNNGINYDGHYNFKSSALGVDGPRVAWLDFNGRLLMCWESGTDKDFNDIIMDVEGVERLLPPPVFTNQSYTLCFEDTKKGDYDLNDVVILATRTNETTLEYQILACGAHDSLFIQNINVAPIFDAGKEGAAEVHELFGATRKEFINTQKGAKKYDPVVVTKSVNKDFQFGDLYAKGLLPYIYDATTEVTVKLAVRGEDPHAIMIPGNFMYPLEKTCVIKAYPRFGKWSQEDGGNGDVISTDWYKQAEAVQDKIYIWATE